MSVFILPIGELISLLVKNLFEYLINKRREIEKKIDDFVQGLVDDDYIKSSQRLYISKLFKKFLENISRLPQVMEKRDIEKLLDDEGIFTSFIDSFNELFLKEKIPFDIFNKTFEIFPDTMDIEGIGKITINDPYIYIGSTVFSFGLAIFLATQNTMDKNIGYLVEKSIETEKWWPGDEEFSTKIEFYKNTLIKSVHYFKNAVLYLKKSKRQKSTMEKFRDFIEIYIFAKILFLDSRIKSLKFIFDGKIIDSIQIMLYAKRKLKNYSKLLMQSNLTKSAKEKFLQELMLLGLLIDIELLRNLATTIPVLQYYAAKTILTSKKFSKFLENEDVKCYIEITLLKLAGHLVSRYSLLSNKLIEALEKWDPRVKKFKEELEIFLKTVNSMGLKAYKTADDLKTKPLDKFFREKL